MSMKAIDEVEVGFKSRFAKKITREDIQKFAEVSGDFNPLHLDDEFAKKTIFGQRIAHGILAVGLISAALTKLPGVVVYLSQNSKFIAPVKIGDIIEATVEVVEKIPEKSQLRLTTYCTNQHGDKVIDGEARVKLLDLKLE